MARRHGMYRIAVDFEGQDDLRQFLDFLRESGHLPDGLRAVQQTTIDPKPPAANHFRLTAEPPGFGPGDEIWPNRSDALTKRHHKDELQRLKKESQD